jgi:hypothetical protein
LLRAAVLLLLIAVVLLVLRTLRILSAALFPRTSRRARPAAEGEMVRDPVCGTWIDRRLALAGRRGAEWIPVCSEECRGQLEAQG